MRATTLVGVVTLLAGCGGTPQKPPAPPAVRIPTDTAAHEVRTVEVASGVTLEVLDFGGTGQPVVLLAGLGNSAHVFDDFAPLLVPHGHVYAITRRGFGVSSGPAEGYDLATRVADDLAVLEALALDPAVLVGHSIAGGELTLLASAHPTRVRALVYLDALGDNVTIDKELIAQLPNPSMGEPTATDLASADAVRAYVTREFGVAFPMGEILAMVELGPDGKYAADRGYPEAGNKMIAGEVSPDYTKVTCPALGLFVTYATPEIALGALRWGRLDAAGQATWTELFPRVRASEAASRDRVQRELAGVKLVELADSHHYVYVRDQREVVDEIERFLAAL